ncbi:hypothetical protein J4217_00775 [Candidatus Pacearchaeota archaeon]|nr:hypothetical protein [Candidatus Pacearchaeota archaeon]
MIYKTAKVQLVREFYQAMLSGIRPEAIFGKPTDPRMDLTIYYLFNAGGKTIRTRQEVAKIMGISNTALQTLEAKAFDNLRLYLKKVK